MSKVSIIIPAYNAERYLRECVESVLRQDYPDIEIIIVNDGSTDNTAEIAESFGVQVISQPNGGISKARNTGIDAAGGEYIFFLDSDDTVFDGAISHLVSILEENPDCDIAVGLMSDSLSPVKSKNRLTVMEAVDVLRLTMYQKVGNDFSACGKLYRKRLFYGADAPRFTVGRRYEDLEFTPRMYLRARKIAYTDTVVYHYRANEESFIHTWSPSRTDALWAVDSVLAFVSDKCPSLTRAAVSRRFSAYYNIFNCAVVNGEKELADRCFAEVRSMAPRILTDSNTRFKNKVGALVALAGKRLASILAKRSF